jgi:hypothetical protein
MHYSAGSGLCFFSEIALNININPLGKNKSNYL